MLPEKSKSTKKRQPDDKETLPSTTRKPTSRPAATSTSAPTLSSRPRSLGISETLAQVLTGSSVKGINFHILNRVFHNMKPKAYNGTQAVQRAMRLLKAFSQGGPELRLTDLARSVELNKTTTFRLLTALESAEMIERTPDGDAYRLGPELLRLGSQT